MFVFSSLVHSLISLTASFIHLVLGAIEKGQKEEAKDEVMDRRSAINIKLPCIRP